MMQRYRYGMIKNDLGTYVQYRSVEKMLERIKELEEKTARHKRDIESMDQAWVCRFQTLKARLYNEIKLVNQAWKLRVQDLKAKLRNEIKTINRAWELRFQTLKTSLQTVVYDFQECPTCAAKPGMPVLCDACVHNRKLISELRKKVEETVDLREALIARYQEKLSRTMTKREIIESLLRCDKSLDSKVPCNLVFRDYEGYREIERIETSYSFKDGGLLVEARRQ